MQQYMEGMVGVSVVGDLNVHHEQWLKFSSGTSADGERMRTQPAGHDCDARLEVAARVKFGQADWAVSLGYFRCIRPCQRRLACTQGGLRRLEPNAVEFLDILPRTPRFVLRKYLD